MRQTAIDEVFQNVQKNNLFENKMCVKVVLIPVMKLSATDDGAN